MQAKSPRQFKQATWCIPSFQPCLHEAEQPALSVGSLPFYLGGYVICLVDE